MSDSKDQMNNSMNGSDKTSSNSKNELRFRENLYRLIISQLFYDGYQHIAVGLSTAIQVKKKFKS